MPIVGRDMVPVAIPPSVVEDVIKAAKTTATAF
jgi:hypothetical protein